ncbi:MAG: zinc ABC transporter substrate-binding protein [Proteobacteria bacterium]|nr:zinc ABC transporter substrate-binding protein [Pseudomonadota bacterium]MBU1594403.1 zinc ABC transporter substrate-binding protein [Pseudomonadota bacterium]
MREVLLMAAAAAFWTILALAGSPAIAAAGPLHVAVGVAPLEVFARRIGGPFIQTTVLVPAGADAHTYEPKPSQMRALSAADLYLSAGLEFENAWEPRLRAANPKLVVVRTDQGLARMHMPEGVGEEHKGGRKALDAHGHAAESDPHVWVSPAHVRLMAARIQQAFAQADPAHAKAYADNLAAFERDIAALDAYLRAVFAGVPEHRRSFLVFHPAWGYLARDYGLTQMAIEFEGKEPSPRRLGAIIAQARARDVRVIFVQPQMSRRTAESIAQAIGARVLAADPLAADWAGNLRAVAESFRDALR